MEPFKESDAHPKNAQEKSNPGVLLMKLWEELRRRTSKEKQLPLPPKAESEHYPEQFELKKHGGSHMNKLQEEIEKLEANDNRGEVDELLLRYLHEKEETLGADPSEEEAEEALNEARKELLMHLLNSRRPEESEEWDETMRSCMEQIRGIFQDMKLHYREYVHQSGVYAFELTLSNNGQKLRIKIYLESGPKTCRIDAIYPFQAEPEFIYPLCLKLAQENYPRRYGALQYDPADHELSYRYSFSIQHGLYEDDFRVILAAVVVSANESYEAVRQYAVGRFRKADREEIICKAQKLIIELDQ